MRCHLKVIGLVLTLVVLSFVIVSCASVPAEVQTQGPVSCQLMTHSDLWTYGTEFTSNPFLEPSSWVVGTPNEFVVLKVTIALSDPATVNVDGTVTATDGSTIGRLYDEKDLEKYWAEWGDSTTKPSRTRIETLQRFYVPGAQFTTPAGKKDYFILLMGKNPLPRPSTVNVTISLNAVPTVFTFTLEPKKK